MATSWVLIISVSMNIGVLLSVAYSLTCCDHCAYGSS
jgi:hypothetical protein